MYGLKLSNCILLALLSVTVARADGPSFWTADSRVEFLKGEADGVSIRADESIALSPELNCLLSLGQPVIWGMALDSRGRIFLATGHDGKLYRVDGRGDTTLVRAFEQSEVSAVAVDSRDNLYAATSPDGAVYRVAPDGSKSEIWFDPEEKYIWALLPGPGGELYVATGPPGKVYRVEAKGKARTVLASDDQHIICLALDHKGNLLAGSSGKALVYQVTPQGGVSILYDSQMKDIRSIVVDSDDNLFVSAFTIQTPGEQPSPLLNPHDESSQPSDEQKDGENNPDSGKQTGQFIIRVPSTPMGEMASSEIYFFDMDRFPTRIWKGTSETVMAIGITPDNHALFVSDKDKSSLYSADNQGDLTLLGDFEDDQATCFLNDRPGGRILIATSNMGRLFALKDSYRSEGRYRSETYNAGLPSQWGAITWTGNQPSGTEVFFRTRSGNTTQPDTTWSPWSAPYHPGRDSRIESPPRMYFQWETVLSSGKKDVTPSLQAVNVSYLRRNRAPLISRIKFLPQGVYIRSSGGGAGSGPEILAENDLPDEVEHILKPRKSNSTNNPFSGKKDYGKGMRMAGWNASDANGDEIRYNVLFRGVDESNWKPLSLAQRDNSIVWNTESMADGWYLLRVVAYDSLDNPGDRALSTGRDSDRFLIDNSPPRIENPRFEKKGPAEADFTFEAVESVGRIEQAQVSLDGEDWRVIYPLDGIADTDHESYKESFSGLAPGEHTVALQLMDEYHNVATLNRTIKLP